MNKIVKNLPNLIYGLFTFAILLNFESSSKAFPNEVVQVNVPVCKTTIKGKIIDDSSKDRVQVIDTKASIECPAEPERILYINEQSSNNLCKVITKNSKSGALEFHSNSSNLDHSLVILEDGTFYLIPFRVDDEGTRHPVNYITSIYCTR